VQLGLPLAFILDAHGQRALEAPRRSGNVLRNLPPDNSVLTWSLPLAQLSLLAASGNDFGGVKA